MNTTLGEYQGIPCHHWEEELPLITEVITAARPQLVIEVGTMYGGFAAFLADLVAGWDADVVTIDHIIYKGIEDVCAPRKNLFFLRGDVFSSVVSSLIIGHLTAYAGLGASTLLYCDGGAKRRELFLLGNFATLVGVHDYGTEVTPEECDAWVAKYNFQPVEEDRFAAIQAAKGGYFVSRFWSRS